MQYILSEEEYKRGCELIKTFETEEMELDKVYEAQNNLKVINSHISTNSI